MLNKEVIVTLKTDLFADKHQLKLYKQDTHFILSEQKRVKRYYDHGCRIIMDDGIMYVFELNFKEKYITTLQQIAASDYEHLIKNPSLTNLDQATDKKIELICTNTNWIYKKYIKYNNDDWVLQFEGPCSVI